MHDEPPSWLKRVVAQHSPAYSQKFGGDIICNGCCDGVVWTPEHLTRMIHMALSDSIAALYV